MDYWTVICCGVGAAVPFLGLVALLVILLIREAKRKKSDVIGEE